jgi:aryl-alcohol dehydrogenase-like predicted oxidoreductase
LSGDAYGSLTRDQQVQLIERARMVGITLFETAECYGRGAMESLLGEQLGNDPNMTIVTKWGTDRSETVAKKCFDGQYLRQAADKTRERLKRDVVDVALLHNPSLAALERGEAADTMKQLQSEGKLLHWGVSAGDQATAEAALDAGAEVLSFSYNAFHQKPLAHLAERLKEANVGVLAHSVLNYGQLCGMWSAYRIFRAPDHRADRWTPEELKARVRHLDALRPVVGGSITSLRAAALRFVLHQSIVGCAVLGPKTNMQLDQLVREAGQPPPYLSEPQHAALLSRLEELEVEA